MLAAIIKQMVMLKPEPFGNYLLIEKVSTGGMAEIQKALMVSGESFKKLVAIKRLLPAVAEDEEFANMFIDEANIAGQLHHANIAQVYDLGKLNEHFFIAMEYVQGRDLRALFERLKKIKRGIPLSMAVFIISKVCEGLDYAHRKKDAQGRPLNIVHRDISPPNILLSFEGDVKIVDFGIAQAQRKLTQTQAGILKGKFGYMSPEQVRGFPLDRRSDIFSLGIVLYEMITGRRLFVGSSDYNTLEKVRSAEIKKPSEINPHVSADLERVVMRALERDLNQRYQWASEFQDDLNRYLYGQTATYTRQNLSEFMSGIFSEDIEAERKRMEDLEKINVEELLREAKQAAYKSLKTDEVKPLPIQQREVFVGKDGKNISPEQAMLIEMEMPSDPIKLVTDLPGNKAAARIQGRNLSAAARQHTEPLIQTPQMNQPGPLPQNKNYNIQVVGAKKSSDDAPEKKKPQINYFGVDKRHKKALNAGLIAVAAVFVLMAVYILLKSPYKTVSLDTAAGVKTASAIFISPGKPASVQLIPYKDDVADLNAAFQVCPKTPCKVPDIPAGLYRIVFSGNAGMFAVPKFHFEPGKEYPPISALYGQSGTKTGVMLIGSEPTGARVEIKLGSETLESGETPFKVKNALAGEKLDVTVSKSGFRTEMFSTILDPYQVFKKEVKLKSSKASFKIISNVMGANIFIDGVDSGKVTPSDVPNLEPGKEYKITLKFGGKTVEKSVVPSAGDDEVSVKFPDVAEKQEAAPQTQKTGDGGTKEKEKEKEKEPVVQIVKDDKTGKLIVTAPKGPTNFVVGSVKGTTPKSLNLKPGLHELQVVLPAGFPVPCGNPRIEVGSTTHCVINFVRNSYNCECKKPE